MLFGFVRATSWSIKDSTINETLDLKVDDKMVFHDSIKTLPFHEILTGL